MVETYTRRYHSLLVDTYLQEKVENAVAIIRLAASKLAATLRLAQYCDQQNWAVSAEARRAISRLEKISWPGGPLGAGRSDIDEVASWAGDAQAAIRSSLTEEQWNQMMSVLEP